MVSCKREFRRACSEPGEITEHCRKSTTFKSGPKWSSNFDHENEGKMGYDTVQVCLPAQIGPCSRLENRERLCTDWDRRLEQVGPAQGSVARTCPSPVEPYQREFSVKCSDKFAGKIVAEIEYLRADSAFWPNFRHIRLLFQGC